MKQQDRNITPAADSQTAGSSLAATADSDALSRYQGQDRVGADNYLAYFAGMDKSMAQKIAMCAAFLSPSGRTADMGSGSGKGSADLAALYPMMQVIGVDIAREAVEHARGCYQHRNLTYAQGDIARKVFEDESLDAILNSSVLHHVTSFNNFDVRELEALFDNQIAQLKPGGRLIIRDFVIPRGPQEVLVEFMHTDGSATGPIHQLSTAAAFEEFARTFKSSLHPDGGVPYQKLEPLRQRFSRFRVALRDATEFILRKDYRASLEGWKAEMLEEYLYMSQASFIQSMTSRGLRVLTAIEIHNPWIVSRRMQGQVFMQDLSGNPLPHVPTNFLIVGQKVREGQGVELVEVSHVSAQGLGFCQLSCYRHRDTGAVMELISRPSQTLDLAPWFRQNEAIYLVVREGYPRPIANSDTASPNLDGSYVAGYLAEPIAAVLGQERDITNDQLQTLLLKAEIHPKEILNSGEIRNFFPSPGAFDEMVMSRDFEISPRDFDYEVPGNYSGFCTSGRVVALEARQLLRSCQVGGMLDNRIELNAYRILLNQGQSLGPWIGAEIQLTEQSAPELEIRNLHQSTESAPALLPYEEISSSARQGFLELRTGDFAEMSASGECIARKSLEYACPAHYSANTISVVPIIRTGDDILVGLETRDLPAAQNHLANARMLVVPAFRMERGIRNLDDAKTATEAKMQKFFQARARHTWPLGGKYMPSPGCSPETVYPVAMEIESASALDSSLRWFSLKDLLSSLDQIKDGHSLTGILRLAHALLPQQ